MMKIEYGPIYEIALLAADAIDGVRGWVDSEGVQEDLLDDLERRYRELVKRVEGE